jgi:hypothetical protein
MSTPQTPRTAIAKKDIYGHLRKDLKARKGEHLKIISEEHKPVYIVENKSGQRFSVRVGMIMLNQ